MVKESLIANLNAPLPAKVEAAHHLAQTMRRSRMPDSMIVGISFSVGGGIIGAELVEKTVPNKEDIEKSSMEHNSKMKALAPEYTRLGEFVPGADVDFICVGNTTGLFEKGKNYFGVTQAEWKP